MLSGKNEKIGQLFRAAAVTLGVYLIFKYMLPIIMPFVIAYALCRWFYPIAVKINHKTKISTGFSGACLVVLFAAASAGLIFFTVRYLTGQLQLLIQNMDSILERVRTIFDSLCQWLGRFFNCDGSYVEALLISWGEKARENMNMRVPDLLKAMGIPVVKAAATFIIVFAVAVIGAILLIKNKEAIDSQIRKSDFSREISEVTAKICQVVGCFFKAQGLIMTVVAFIISIGLFLSGNKYAVLIGIIVAVMDALPVLGSGTVLVPWAVIDVFLGNYKQAAILAAVFAACAVSRELMEARLMGTGLGINEFYMLMATFIGMNLFGIWGIILGPLGLILVLEILYQIRQL